MWCNVDHVLDLKSKLARLSSLELWSLISRKESLTGNFFQRCTSCSCSVRLCCMSSGIDQLFSSLHSGKVDLERLFHYTRSDLKLIQEASVEDRDQLDCSLKTVKSLFNRLLKVHCLKTLWYSTYSPSQAFHEIDQYNSQQYKNCKRSHSSKKWGH